MKNKKETKVILGIIIFLIIIIIATVVTILYILRNDENTGEQDIANTSNSINNTDNTNNTNNTSPEIIMNSEDYRASAIDVAEEKYNIAKSVYWKEEFEYAESYNENYRIITNFEEISNYFTQNGLSDLINTLGIVNEHSSYMLPNTDDERDGTWIDYTDFTLKSITENEMIFTSYNYYFASLEDKSLNAEYEMEMIYSNSVEARDTEFKLVYEDGDWKIDTFILPN